MDFLSSCVKTLNDILWGWPLILFFLGVGTIATLALNFVQFRYFFKSWKLVLAPQEQVKDKKADMSPFQAFVNALSTSIGNGSLVGMATAVHEGGPGAAFWIFILGFFSLPIRYCEVYLGGAFEGSGNSITSGGPMLYLQKVPGGLILPSLYAFFCLLLAFISGNAIQANSVSCGLQHILPVNVYVLALLIGLFVAYIVFGGAQRIIKFSVAIVPLKVGLFFVSTLLLILYNLPTVIAALKIMAVSAFTPQAVKGAIIGTTMQSAIRFGMSRIANSTEVGLGIAAVFFGSTGSKNPVENGIMSMASAFISNYLVGFVLAFVMVLTGVWSSGLTGIDLTTQAYSTLYGSVAGWLVTLLSITFGIGVLVGYAYIGRECWSYLTGGRFLSLYSLIYCGLAFFGSISKVQLVWDAVDIVNAGLVAINLYAILYLMPKIREALKSYSKNS